MKDEVSMGASSFFLGGRSMRDGGALSTLRIGPRSFGHSGLVMGN
jgi:hypothetical protein